MLLVAPSMAVIAPDIEKARVDVVNLKSALEVSDAQEGSDNLFISDSGITVDRPIEFVVTNAPNKFDGHFEKHGDELRA